MTTQTIIRICAVDGCERERIYRMYCHAHYRRWRRSGDPGPAAIKGLGEGPRTCRFDGCKRPKRTRGLCAAHYLRDFHGKPLAQLKNRPDTLARDEHGRKQCAICDDWLRTENFYGNALTRDGLATRCIRCHRDLAIRKKYGITLNEYEALLKAQSGGCAICGGQDFRDLSIDHDHKTGEVRGLLCTPCNRGIGNFRDSPALLLSANNYLSAHHG